jgi:hypothetical protein
MFSCPFQSSCPYHLNFHGAVLGRAAVANGAGWAKPSSLRANPLWCSSWPSTMENQAQLKQLQPQGWCLHFPPLHRLMDQGLSSRSPQAIKHNERRSLMSRRARTTKSQFCSRHFQPTQTPSKRGVHMKTDRGPTASTAWVLLQR